MYEDGALEFLGLPGLSPTRLGTFKGLGLRDSRHYWPERRVQKGFRASRIRVQALEFIRWRPRLKDISQKGGAQGVSQCTRCLLESDMWRAVKGCLKHLFESDVWKWGYSPPEVDRIWL